MKRTTYVSLIGFALVGGAVGYLLELILTSRGALAIVPPLTLPVTLLIVAGAVIAFALPVRRALKAETKKHIDPFYAMRVAVLSKASAMVGALLCGVGLGILVFLVGRPVVPDWNVLGLALAHVFSALILVIAALIAESFCVLPPDDSEEEGIREPSA